MVLYPVFQWLDRAVVGDAVRVRGLPGDGVRHRRQAGVRRS